MDKTSVEAKILFGRILTGMGNFSEARIIYMAILKEQTNNMSAFIALAELEVAEGNILNALELYKNALEKTPENRKALISSIILFDSINKNKISETYVEEVLILYPENAHVNYIAAKHYYESDNINTALEYGTRAYAIDSGNFSKLEFNTLVNLGFSFESYIYIFGKIRYGFYTH